MAYEGLPLPLPHFSERSPTLPQASWGEGGRLVLKVPLDPPRLEPEEGGGGEGGATNAGFSHRTRKREGGEGYHGHEI